MSLGQRLSLAMAWFALAGLLGGPLLSALAISKIRASAGRLYGLGPAVLGLYLIPFAAMDLFLFGASSTFLESRLEDKDGLALFLPLVVLLLALYWNRRVIRGSLKKLSKTALVG